MNAQLLNKCRRRVTAILCALLASGTVLSSGCLDNDISKRFRDAFSPGFTEGLTTALAADGQGAAGLRQIGTALADALGAVIQSRTPATSGSSSTSTSTP
jgi:hypothetical protein